MAKRGRPPKTVTVGDDVDDGTSFMSGGPTSEDEGRWNSSPVVERVWRELKRARDQQTNWREAARSWRMFYDGDQWSSADVSKMRELAKPAITYNRIGPMVDLLVGYEIQNRQRMLFIPRDPIDNPDATGAADLATSAYEWALETCDGDYERTEAFRDMLITGIGWTSARMDYDEDPDGKWTLTRTMGEEMWHDPGARQANLADAKWVAHVRKIHIDEIARRFGEDKEEAVRSAVRVEQTAAGGLLGGGSSKVIENSPDYYSPGAVQHTPGIRELIQDEDGYVELIDFQWSEAVPIYRIFKEDGKTESLSEKKWKELRKLLKEEGEEAPRAVRMTTRAVKRVWVCGPVQLDEVEDFPFACFTHNAMTMKWDENRRMWYGIVRAMKDPQEGANKYFSLAVHLLSISPKGTYLVEKGALASPQTFTTDIAKPGATVWLNEGAIRDQRFKIEPPPDVPAVTKDLLEFSIRSLHDAPGIQPEMLGMSGEGAPQRGAPMQKLQTQGMTVLAPIFNALTRYRRTEARLALEFIRAYMSDGRMVRIGGPFDAQYLPLIRDKTAVRMDLSLDDVPVDPNERRYVWESLQPYGSMMMREGMFDSSFWDLAPWPKSVIERVKKKWAEKEQAGQQMQQGPTKKDEDPQYIASEVALNQAQALLATKRAEALERESSMDMATQTQDIMLKDRGARMSTRGDRTMDNLSENGKSRSPKFPGVRPGNGR